MSGVRAWEQADQCLAQAQLQQRTGTSAQSCKQHSGHKQGTPFPAPALGPKADNHSATEARTCPLQAGTCSGPSSSPWYHWGCVSLQPLPANPGDEEPFLGGPRKSFWLKQHLLLLLHLLLSHLYPSSAYTPHILLGSRVALCTAGVLNKGHRHPVLLPESCEVWGGGSIRPLPRLGWRG